MIAVTGPLVAATHRRAPRRDQSGFAMMIVLAVIALTSVIVVALIGMAFSTAAVAANQSIASRQTRSADGALESAVATMATSTDNGVCPGVRNGTTVSFDNATPSTADDDQVTLTCSDAAISSNPSAPLGGNDVKIVGDSGNTLTSSGSAALRFDADVTTRSSAAVSTTTAGGPAVALAGQYMQGGAGPGGSGSDCGILDPAGPQPTSAVDDRDHRPVCGDAAAAGLTVNSQQLVNIDDPVAAPARTVPAACPAGPVVQLDPGRYDAVATSALNQLLSGSCKNKVFWFTSSNAGRPAVFAFDASPYRSGGAALVINDATARVIVGKPTGGVDAAAAAAATFPNACDRGAPGASFQLSGRMALTHLAGRVAMCPAWNGSAPFPALVQVPIASIDPVTVAASSNDFKLANGQGGGPALLARPDDSSASATGAFICPWSGGVSTCSLSFSASFANVPAVAALKSVKVTVASRETPPAPWPTVPRRAVLQLRNAAGATVCTTGAMEGGRTNWQISAYDLMIDAACSSALKAQGPAVLEGSTVDVRYTYGPDGCTVNTQWWVLDCGERLSVRGVRLLVEGTSMTGATATGTALSTPENMLVDDVANARFAQESCGLSAFPCSYDKPGTAHDAEIGNIQVPSGLSGPPASLRLVVKSRPTATTGQSWVSDPVDDSRTQIQVTLRGGTTCTVESSGYSHSAQESHYDLLRGTPNCAATITDLAQLAGASVRVRYITGCAWIGGARAPVGSDGRCVVVSLPELQYVGLVATSASAGATPPSTVTVSGGAGTDFHAFGAATLPRAALQVRWNGTAEPATPLFFGSLVVASLDSRMAAGAQMGVVCCEPPRSDQVKVEAAVDGRTRGVAVLAVDPRADGQPGHSVVVQDWQLCVTATCKSLAESSGGP